MSGIPDSNIKEDRNKAKNWFKISVATGNDSAKFFLSEIYQTQNTTNFKPQKASKLLQELIKIDYPESLKSLYSLIRSGFLYWDQSIHRFWFDAIQENNPSSPPRSSFDLSFVTLLLISKYRKFSTFFAVTFFIKGIILIILKHHSINFLDLK